MNRKENLFFTLDVKTQLRHAEQAIEELTIENNKLRKDIKELSDTLNSIDFSL